MRSFLCQMNEAELMKHQGLVQPRAIPNSNIESISMDFIVDLPKTQKDLDSIFVVVDRLTKVSGGGGHWRKF
jgi:hypothetical protein